MVAISTICPTVAAEIGPRPLAAQELVFGNGTAGPFPLSWTAVRIGSERVSVSETRLRFGLDYFVDYETGAIAFAQPLRRDQIARVDYAYDAARAKANHAPAQAPLSLLIWGGDSGSLQMIGAVRPAAAPGAAPAASLLGFRGETALGGGQFSSLFLLAPEATGAGRAAAWQSAALRFGAARDAGPFKFHGSVAQAGTGFAPASEYQLQQGLRVLDFGAAFDPSKRVSLTSQVSRQDALDPTGKAKEQASIKNQLTLAPSDGTKLILSHESATKARAQGGPETLDSLRAQIEQKFGGATATALAERRSTDATGTTTTASVDLGSRLAAGTRLSAGFVRTDNDRRGVDATTRVGLETQAAPQLRLRTDLSHRDSAKEGRTDSVSLGVQAGREQTIALNGAFNRTLAEKTGADTAADLGLSIRPAMQLGFRLGFHQHLTEKQGDMTGSDWGVTAGPNGLLKVERQIVEKVAASGPGEQEERLRMETTPLRGVKVATQLATKHVGRDPSRDTRETSVELSPLHELQVAGALREQEVDNGTTHVRSLSASVKPGRFMDLSGAYKTRDAPAGDAVITRHVRLALAPVSGLKLQGAYTQNPEDKDGRVLDTTDTSLGLESTIGSLVLGGTYTAGATKTTPRATEKQEYRLALNLWGNTRFYSAYKQSEERAAGVTHGRTLSLGFTRSLSSSFYLLLEGEMTQVEVNGVPQPGLGDQRAQAKLGLRF